MANEGMCNAVDKFSCVPYKPILIVPIFGEPSGGATAVPVQDDVGEGVQLSQPLYGVHHVCQVQT